MKKCTLLICALFLINIQTYAWDRYSNETEVTFYNGTNATNIPRYTFYLSTTTYVDFYTDGFSGGDTYMYLWDGANNVQVAKSDDASVPSG